jgi:C-terminal processing protease CtpA/Prc
MFSLVPPTKRLLAAIFAVTFLSFPAAGIAEGGESQSKPIGISIQVSTDSLFGGNVTSIKVTKVAPGSQAQHAGISEGDEVVKIQGVAVVGADARSLKSHMSFTPGEPKVLVLRKQGGREYEAVLVKGSPSKT